MRRCVLRSAVAATVVFVATGCSDAILLEVTGDRPIPAGFDTICLGVADTASGGGQFGRVYALEGKQLPQSLRIEPGSADSAYAWVRADRGGVPVQRTGRFVDFGGDVSLDLATCPKGANGTPAVVGSPAGPAGARLVASQGAGGEIVVALAVATTDVTLVDGDGGALVATPAPQARPEGALVDAIAADVDGDCDDDLVIATDAAPPIIWVRSGATFTPGPSLGGAPATALAAADVDRDGAVDLITATHISLVLWRNDGAGGFGADTNVDSTGLLSARALATADVDGNGTPDLIVGQTGDPMRGFLGDGAGFQPAQDAIVAAVPLDVARFELVDANGDFAPDLAVASVAESLRLYVNRTDGRLDDRTHVFLGDAPMLAHAVAIGTWDQGCPPDAAIASDVGGPALRGDAKGALVYDADLPPASDVVLVDIDDDGVQDVILSTAEGAIWVAR